MSSNQCRQIGSVFARFEGTSNRDFDITFTDGTRLACYSIEGSFQYSATDNYVHAVDPSLNLALEDVSAMAEGICAGFGWDQDCEVAEITLDISSRIPVVKSFCRKDTHDNVIP